MVPHLIKMIRNVKNEGGVVMPKKSMRFLFLVFIVMILLTACNNTTKDSLYDNDPPQFGELSTEYYANLGITEDTRKTALAVTETCQTSSGKELQLRLPEYWESIYRLELQTIEAGDVTSLEAVITLYEKYNYDLMHGGGLLCYIDVYPIDDFNQIFLPHIPEAYDQIIGANSSIIGTDDQYVYLLSLPTDAQYDFEDRLATELYENGMQAKDKIIDDFLSVNQITVNEKSPVLN